MLEIINQLGTMGWTNILTVIVLILFLFAEFDNMIDGVCKFLKRFGIEITTKHQIRENEQEQEIQKLKEELEEYQSITSERETEWHQQSIDIRGDLLANQKSLTSTLNQVSANMEALTKQLLEEKIQRMRWRILDFSDSLANGNSASLEQFNNIIETHTKYENILQENSMSNGLVSASYEFILQKYQELLNKGNEEETE